MLVAVPIEDLTLAQCLDLFPSDVLARMIRWKVAKTPEQRVAIIEEALDDAYGRLIDQRGLARHRSEDELTMQVANMLCHGGIDAHHDRHVNGHCDLVITASNNFLWLGEAKVHGGYDWLDSGFQQLSKRYSSALTGRDHGELIIYHRQGNSREVLEMWQARVAPDGGHVRLVEKLQPPTLSFRTVHACPNTGNDFHVRHVIVPLQHAPTK